MDAGRISELGVAGFVDSELAALVAGEGFDIDDFWSIGIAGPVSPELLKSIALVGPGRVAEAIHSVIAGPVDPDELAALMNFGLSEVVEAAFRTGQAPFDSATELLAAVAPRRS